MYSYDLYYDGCCLHSEEGFETEEDARYDAECMIDSKIDQWDYDDPDDAEVFHNRDNFEIILEEY